MNSLRLPFLALIALALAGPALAAPGKTSQLGVDTSSSSAKVRFKQVPGSTWYYLWVNKGGSAHLKQWYEVANITCDGQMCTIDSGLNLGMGSYQIWVKTFDSSGHGPWSDPYEFEMGAGGELGELDPSVGAPIDATFWLDHLAFQAGSDAVAVGFDAFDSGVGDGVSGLLVDAGAGAGTQVIEQGLSIPPGLLVNGVHLCLESSAAGAFVDEVRIEQLSDPPSATTLVLQDATDLNLAGANCYDSAAPAAPIDPADGALRLQIQVSVAGADRIVLRAAGLNVESDPDDPIQAELRLIKESVNALGGHTHIYRTGRGTGHNNTPAETTSPVVEE